MIYLVLKIFVYLLLALLMGAGAGWLLRQLSAQRESELLKRALNDAKSRIPQLESTARHRDERLRQMRDELEQRQEALDEQSRQMSELAESLRKKERELIQRTPEDSQRALNPLLEEADVLEADAETDTEVDSPVDAGAAQERAAPVEALKAALSWARSRRSIAACPWAKPGPAAPRRKWWRPTCAW